MADDKFVAPVPLPTDYEREILTIFGEECCEAAQRASKIHRFGAEDRQSGQELTNVDRLSDEYGDVLAMGDVLAKIGLLDIPRALAQKPKKLEKLWKYLQHDGDPNVPDAMRQAAYAAAAKKCLNAGDDCDRCCDFCRDMIDAALDAAEGKRERHPETESEAREPPNARCPRCRSPDPARHPAMQSEGEVQLCEDDWHKPTANEIRERESAKAKPRVIANGGTVMDVDD